MSAAPGTRSAAARRRTQLSARVRAYEDLLQAHEHAHADGRPLLTEAGVCYIRQRLLPSAAASERNTSNGPAPRRNHFLPFWDSKGRRLWLGGKLLKEFRQPAPNQTMLLDVFQEQGWTEAHIDDPLPPEPGEREEDVKRRLHETIKNLNRALPAGTIRFRGDGTGQGVAWVYDRR